MPRNFSVCPWTDSVDETKDCVEVLVILEVLLSKALDLAVLGKYFRLNNTTEDCVIFEVPVEDMLYISAFE
jgi:hypothetical protein